MKNGCNFHALQVKSNYKIFSEKIEPKKDACRMAIKIKGKLPLKICSVLFVLYGAASLVALLLCLVMVVGLIPAAMAAGPEGDRNYIPSKQTMEAMEVPAKDCSSSQRVTLHLAKSRSAPMTLPEMATPSSAGPPTPTARRSITTARLFPYPNCLPDAPTLFCTLFCRRTM